MAFILSAAVPWPPLMMAPAWPCGVREARSAGDKTHHRLLHIFLHKLRRGLLGRAANLADHDDGFRLGIVIQQPQRVNVRGADNGSPPMPIAVDCPMPRCVSWCTAS